MDIKCNFKELRIEFKYEGKKVLIRGTHKYNVEWMSDKKSKEVIKQVLKAKLHSMALSVYPRNEISCLNLDVNIRPYKHLPTQKDAIDSMVKDLLEVGVIRKSHSPIALPIIMVKKKDSSWRMCVDYRQLKKQTIKDKFLISIIEELIDELHRAKLFTKWDLR
nr:reverse transcriptase [Tanacetum cinerariifolium]